MCGILGWVNGEGLLQEVLDTLGHRGPDGRGALEVAPGVRLLHTRLSIIDLSECGSQPMVDRATGNAIVYNGELYNWRELREELSDGRPWLSHTDTEVVLRAWQRWGLDSLSRLRGMFAFAIRDAGARELVLSRDRFGIKPLYFARRGRTFAFASEIRALLATGIVDGRADPVRVREYLRFQSALGNGTLLDGVETLEPGSWLRVAADGSVRGGRWAGPLGAGESKASRVWERGLDDIREPLTPALSPAGERGESAASIVEILREAFEEAVRGHLEADVPVGAFLSGGLDSTAIVGTLAKIGVTPKTFTVCFAEGDDESAAARLAAERAGAEHHEIRLSRDEVLAMVPEAVARMDSPSADGVNTYIVSKAVHDQGMKVALSGLGGDELFGGYPSFARARSAWGRILGATPRGVRALPEWIVAGVAGYSTRLGKLADVLGGTGSMTDLYLEGRALFSRGQVERLTGERAPEHPRRGELLELEGRLAGDRSKGGRRPPSIGPEARPAGLTFISHAEIRTYMHDTLLRDTDQMSMAHSLEVRVPFLDGPFAELVLSLPDEVKFAGTGPKPLLVRAFADRIPEELHRLPKRGFTLPMDAWMRGALREYCLERITSAALEDAGVDRGEAMKVWRAFETGRARWSRAWALVVLADWRGKSEMKNGK